jgi:hypothetical protein
MAADVVLGPSVALPYKDESDVTSFTCKNEHHKQLCICHVHHHCIIVHCADHSLTSADL